MARQRLAGQERAQRIIRAAMELFARRGFRGVTSRQIARAAGVSEALVFKHFPRMDSLYDAILEQKLRDIERDDVLEKALEARDDTEFLRRLAAGIMLRVESDQSFLRLFLHSALEGHPLARRFRRARVDLVHAAVEQRIRRRFARRRWSAPVDPGLAARAFVGMIQASVLNRHIFREPAVLRTSIDRWARTLAEIFLHGLSGAQEAR